MPGGHEEAKLGKEGWGGTGRMRTGQGVTGVRQKQWNFIACVFSLIRIGIKPKIQNDRNGSRLGF